MVRIFVPVNFSQDSINALSYAITLCQKLVADITLLYCSYSLLEQPDEVLSQDEIQTRFNKLIQQHSHRLSDNLTMHSKILQGYPEDVLVDISIKEEPDAIVMGTSSKGETIKELLGSVTSDVVKNAKVPVLAVPSESSIDINSIHQILLVTDFGEQDYRSLHKLIKLITPFQTVVHAVHFATSAPDRWDKKRLEEMRLYSQNTYRKYKMNFEFITGENFIESLDTYIQSKKIGMIAMTRRKRTMISKLFHPSITRKILFHTDVPLLVFHE